MMINHVRLAIAVIFTNITTSHLHWFGKITIEAWDGRC